MTHLSIKLIVILSSLLISHVALALPKVLYINSYHAGYEWSDKAQETFLKALPEDSYQTHVIYMDTKRNKKEEEIRNKAYEISKFVEIFKPDIIVAADDNASKYVIKPYFSYKETPVVFHGVNLDASIYGYPYSNTTGLIELEGLEGLLKATRAYTQSNSVGMIFADTTTGNKKRNFYRNRNMGDFESFIVRDFDEFMQKALEINGSKDILAIDGVTALEGYDFEKAKQFLKENFDIPIVSVSTSCKNLVHYGYVNRPEEHGAWAAQAVKRILDGANPSDIPIEESSHSEIYINYSMLEGSGQKPPERFVRLPHISIR